MAQAARRGHPPCATCKAPTSVRAQIAQRARRGDSLRSISEYAVNEGHALGKDGIARHLRACVGITDRSDGTDPASRSVLTASTVGWVLRSWPSQLDSIAEALHEHGLTVEADTVLAADPDRMRRAFGATEGSPAAELLAARCLALACSRVLGVAHPEVSLEIAQKLKEQGADELEADFIWLSERATTNRRSEDRCSPLAAGLPPAVSNEEETP